MEKQKLTASELAAEKRIVEGKIYKLLNEFSVKCSSNDFKLSGLDMVSKEIAGGRQFVTSVKITIE
jgi:hypothetical protein